MTPASGPPPGCTPTTGWARDTGVSWELPTWNQSLVLVGALARLGARQNPLIPIYRGREVGFITEQSDASAADRAHRLPRASTSRPWPGRSPPPGHGLSVLVVDRDLPDGDPSGLPEVEPPVPATAAEAPIRWLFYTSGTTADPKGAPHTDLTVMASALAMSECLDIRSDDVSALIFPFTHIGGIGWLMAALFTGCTLLTTEAFDPKATTPGFLAANDVTLAGSGTPFHLAYLAAQRAAGRGSASFPTSAPTRAAEPPSRPSSTTTSKREIGGVGIVSGYGLTEAPIVVMATHPRPRSRSWPTPRAVPLPGSTSSSSASTGAGPAPAKRGRSV